MIKTVFIISSFLATTTFALDQQSVSEYEIRNNGISVSDVSMFHFSISKLDSIMMPKEKVFGIKACLVDVEGAPLPPNIGIEIKDDHSSIQSRTDFNGCANWNEVIPFSTTRMESDLNYRKTITLIDVSVTQVTKIEFFLNPFSNKIYPRPKGTF